MIERGRAGVMNAPGFFAHGDDAAAGGFSRSEVDVGELGEGVADLVVDGALADFAAFDVGDGNAQGERDGGGGQHLVAIGDEQQQVGTPGGERVGEREDGDADGFGHAGIGVGTEQALDARLDGKAVAFDFGDGVAEFRREMRAEGEDAEFDVRVCGEFAERPVEMAVVGARGGDDGDVSFGFPRLTHRRPASARWSAGRERYRSGCSRERGHEERRAQRRDRVLGRHRAKWRAGSGVGLVRLNGESM